MSVQRDEGDLTGGKLRNTRLSSESNVLLRNAWVSPDFDQRHSGEPFCIQM